MARQLTWTLLEATEGVFSTCDQPVTFWPHFTDPFPQPVGLLTAERTTFPLSPGLTLQIRTPTEEEHEVPSDERQHRRTVDLDELYWMNAMVTEHAHSNVSARGRSARRHRTDRPCRRRADRSARCRAESELTSARSVGSASIAFPASAQACYRGMTDSIIDAGAPPRAPALFPAPR